eukprot:gb/GFBE01082008.1/.p1 GENE.gb/GFBE01082008.1/~~gb/GFBE01082008.1/.p1  ORF type:complete len:568 (+),score=125.24 gb/GFBE01082008.1/:1-1704(+)
MAAEGDAVAISNAGHSDELATPPQALLMGSAGGSRPPSPRLCSLSLMTQRVRSGSTPGSNRVAVKSSGDAALLGAVRKQMEAMEEKLNVQISRVQQQSDRLRDAAFSRVDAKMGSIESLQPKLDRRIAELNGNYKGLSDEMQAQIRRIDQMDSRLWEWRHQLEDEIRTKFSEIEQSQQQISSAARLSTASSEDQLKRCNRRLVRLEGLVDERLAAAEDVNQSLLNLHARLSEVEDLRNQDSAIFRSDELALAPAPASSPAEQLQVAGDHCAIVALESRVSDATTRLEHWTQESHDIHARLEAQEERLKSLRTLIETKEEHYRWLSDRVERTDWEGRFKEIQSQVHDLEQYRVGHGEQLKLVQQKHERQEEAQEALNDQFRRLQDRGFAAGVGADGDFAGLSAVHAVEEVQAAVNGVVLLPEQVKDCSERLSKAEARLEAMFSDLNSLQGDASLAPRVAVLVEQLKQVAPRVMAHEVTLRDVSSKVGKLEVEFEMDHQTIEKTTDFAKQSDCMVARIGRLEVEVSRIKAEVEGGDMPEDDDDDDQGGDDVDELPEVGRVRSRRASSTE